MTTLSQVTVASYLLVCGVEMQVNNGYILLHIAWTSTCNKWATLQ